MQDGFYNSISPYSLKDQKTTNSRGLYHDRTKKTTK